MYMYVSIHNTMYVCMYVYIYVGYAYILYVDCLHRKHFPSTHPTPSASTGSSEWEGLVPVEMIHKWWSISIYGDLLNSIWWYMWNISIYIYLYL